VKVFSLVVLTKIDVYCLLVIKFLDIRSAFEHYKRVLRVNGPLRRVPNIMATVFTWSVEHYHAHTGQFIIGAVFRKDARRDPGSFFGLLSEPP